MLAFITAQRQPRVAGNVIRIEDGESGLSSRTIRRRLATIAGFYDYLVVRGDVAANPVPRGLASRRGGQRAVRGVPLIRAPRTLPRVIDPAEIDAFFSALRKHRDRAMVDAMLLGGCVDARSLGCGSRTSTLAIGLYSSPMARAATSGSCRSRPGSLPPWRRISTRNGPPTSRPTGSSSRSRVNGGANPCPRPGSTRSSLAPVDVPGSPR